MKWPKLLGYSTLTTKVACLVFPNQTFNAQYAEEQKKQPEKKNMKTRVQAGQGDHQESACLG